VTPEFLKYPSENCLIAAQDRVKFQLVSRSPGLWLVIFLAAALAAAAFAPLEKTLGMNARLVYFHGAWVWAALITFVAAALMGLAGLLSRRVTLHHWSLALGRTAIVFWLAFLPMSLLVMQANWNGLFLDEPRFRVPLNFAIVGVLLQVGVSFFPPVWASLANLVFGVALLAGLSSAGTVLHPESPIFGSGATGIQLYFAGLVLLLAMAAWQMARLWWSWELRKSPRQKVANAG
jgi:hypothetical protein